MGLGNLIERALNVVGLSQDNVERWVGAPCGCEERKQKLNQLSAWASRIVKGKTANAKAYLSGIIGESITVKPPEDLS